MLSTRSGPSVSKRACEMGRTVCILMFLTTYRSVTAHTTRYQLRITISLGAKVSDQTYWMDTEVCVVSCFENRAGNFEGQNFSCTHTHILQPFITLLSIDNFKCTVGRKKFVQASL